MTLLRINDSLGTAKLLLYKDMGEKAIAHSGFDAPYLAIWRRQTGIDAIHNAANHFFYVKQYNVLESWEV